MLRNPVLLRKAALYPYKLNNRDSLHFVMICHGSIYPAELTTPPTNVSVFHPSENTYRGLYLNFNFMETILHVMFGLNGSNMETFFNAMLGGDVKGADPDYLAVIPQIAYTTPGHSMYDYYLKIEEDNERNLCGCWNITNALPTFGPTDFRWIDPVSNDPNVNRLETAPGKPMYEPEVEIRDLLINGTYASRILPMIQAKYPGKYCFVTILCCAGLDAALPASFQAPVQPPAMSHFAIDRTGVAGSASSRRWSRVAEGRALATHPLPDRETHPKNAGEKEIAKDIKTYILGARKANPRTYTKEVNEFLAMFDAMMLEHTYKNGKTTIIVHDTKNNIPWFSFRV